MIDSSFMTTLPDTWAINQRFIFLAINNWDSEYERVNLGGLTCDSEDFYNAEVHSNAIFYLKFKKGSNNTLIFPYRRLPRSFEWLWRNSTLPHSCTQNGDY